MVAPWARKQVQTWRRGDHEPGREQAPPPAPPRASPYSDASQCCLLSSPPPSPRHPLTLQYQVDGEAQVNYSQQRYKNEVGRVREAGQVDDHKVEVDSTDQRHDGRGDGLAQPGRKEGGSGPAASPPPLHCPKPAWSWGEESEGMHKATFFAWTRPLAHYCLLGPPGSTLPGSGKSRL